MASDKSKKKQKQRLDGMSVTELREELVKVKQEALNLRFRNATGQLEHTSEIPLVRRQIARINTLIRQRELAAENAQ